MLPTGFCRQARLDCLQPQRSDCFVLQPNVPARVRVAAHLELGKTAFQDPLSRRSRRSERHVEKADSVLCNKKARMRSHDQRFRY